MNGCNEQIECDFASKYDEVSVIIPTFNRQHTLLRAVNSVLQQTYPVHEILICDDGSEDHSKTIISGLNNAKIKWLDCGKNGRPSIPRNKGIKAASGEWVAFLDSDDEWLPNKIEIQINLLKETGSQAVSSNAFRIVGEMNKGPYLSYKSNTITFQNLLVANNNICSSVMVRKILLEEISLFPEENKYKAIEDYVLWLRISTRIDFAYINLPLLKYCDDPKSSIRINFTDIWELKKVVFTGFLEWIKKNEIELQTEDEKKLAAISDEIIVKNKTSMWKVLKQRCIKLKNLFIEK